MGGHVKKILTIYMLMWRGCGCWLRGKIFVKLVKNQAVISQFTASNLDSCRYVVGNFLGCYGYFLSQLKKTFVGLEVLEVGKVANEGLEIDSSL